MTNRPRKPSFKVTIFLLLVSGVSLYFCSFFVTDDLVSFYLSWQPNYSYAKEAQTLLQEGKLQEALDLARYIKDNPDLPGREAAQEVYALSAAEIEKKYSLWGRTKRFARGFAIGDSESAEEMTGAAIGDFFLWGDIRDLSVHSYRKIIDDERGDYFIIAISSLGILTTALPHFDLFASITKGLRKAGLLSAKFADEIVALTRATLKIGGNTKLATAKLGDVAGNVKLLTDKMSMPRVATVLKNVDSVDDVQAVAKFVKNAPDATYMYAKSGGIGAMRIMEPTVQNTALLNKAAKKGSNGFEILTKYTLIKNSVLVKNLYKGIHFLPEIVMKFLKNLKKGYLYATTIGSLCVFSFALVRYPRYWLLLLKSRENRREDM